MAVSCTHKRGDVFMTSLIWWSRDLLKALSKEKESIKVHFVANHSQSLICIYVCFVCYLHNFLPPCYNSKKRSQAYHHQPCDHGHQWELHGLFYKCRGWWRLCLNHWYIWVYVLIKKRTFSCRARPRATFCDGPWQHTQKQKVPSGVKDWRTTFNVPTI